MFQIRGNKPRRLMSHEMAAVAVRTRFMARMTRTNVLVIVVGWGKEAAP